MNYYLQAIIIAILADNSHITITCFRQNKIHVDIYYESLCPYSALFITKQFIPVYQYLQDLITVTFIPFGKATAIGYPIKFMCQHGPSECIGNQAQACALTEIIHNFKSNVQQNNAVKIVGCVMASRNPSVAVLKCVKNLGLEANSIQKIKICKNTNIGKELLVTYGRKTAAFESPLLSVPSIVINGAKNKNAVSNFIGEICDLISKDKKPKPCQN
ncbi:PREDICTED: gamma-interferon-inducible lysosomal thiol reductase-like [Ceratosolen solmsi marchali]|uniref:Gamma-interferon-inducible lysosomal thiol reductase-like n=1 Tax=Ceratosolen solmsi marchali TaxID=326594 RepID=A0AAJ6YQH6_9HYME|nr:PREDICTED: gamma-interferon-inducible lysosomal thiol reductase-like [Ceratosolen solmsi marchali]